MQPIVVSDSLVLAPLDLRDAPELFALTDRNRSYLRQWLPWLDNIVRIEDTRAFIRASQAQASQNNGTQLGLRVDGQVVGIVGHHQIDWRNRLTSLGYWIGQEYQGRGLVTAATGALLRHAFTDARLNRVEIRCAERNTKSRAIPQRLGFREEGLLRDAEWLYDHFVDHVVYGLVSREWAAATRGTTTMEPVPERLSGHSP